MLEIDTISLLVSVDTDISMADLEAQLDQEGYTLNYYAAPDNRMILAEALGQRLPNLYSPAFGGLEDLALQVKWAQNNGEVYANVATPRSAAGPGFKKLAIGSNGWLGLPIQALLRIFPKPEARHRLFGAFVREESLKPFFQSLKRAGIVLPLSAKISTAAAAERFADLGLFESVWAAEVWGANDEVAALLEELEAALVGKGGRVLEGKEGFDEEEARELLFASALDEMARRLETAESRLPASHLRLMRRLKGAE